MNGEDTYAIHFSAGDCLGAKCLVPVTDKAVEVGRITLQILRHRIEEREQVSVLLFDAAHIEQCKKFFQ